MTNLGFRKSPVLGVAGRLKEEEWEAEGVFQKGLQQSSQALPPGPGEGLGGRRDLVLGHEWAGMEPGQPHSGEAEIRELAKDGLQDRRGRLREWCLGEPT